MWAVARIDLGLSDEEFGNLTYGLFDTLLLRKEAQEKKEFMRTGMIASAVMNFSMCHPDRHISAMEFVPGYDEKKQLDQMTPEQVSTHMITQFAKKDIRHT